VLGHRLIRHRVTASLCLGGQRLKNEQASMSAACRHHQPSLVIAQTCDDRMDRPKPTMTGRVIAAWPSFALIGSYELLMWQIRATAAALSPRRPRLQPPRTRTETSTLAAGASVAGTIGRPSQRAAGNGMRQQALEWALANRGEDGKLPSGKTIAGQFGRHERWGRLVKQHVANARAGPNAEEAAA
jgi:hypothetical protein